MLVLPGVRGGGHGQVRTGQPQARVEHGDGLERLGAGPVEHRAAHVAALLQDRAVPVDQDQGAVVGALVQAGPVDPGQLDVRAGRALVRGRHRTELGGDAHRAPAAVAAVAARATDARIASIRSAVSRPRWATMSATPRPLISASWATSVAFS